MRCGGHEWGEDLSPSPRDDAPYPCEPCQADGSSVVKIFQRRNGSAIYRFSRYVEHQAQSRTLQLAKSDAGQDSESYEVLQCRHFDVDKNSHQSLKARPSAKRTDSSGRTLTWPGEEREEECNCRSSHNPPHKLDARG